MNAIGECMLKKIGDDKDWKRGWVIESDIRWADISERDTGDQVK